MHLLWKKNRILHTSDLFYKRCDTLCSLSCLICSLLSGMVYLCVLNPEIWLPLFTQRRTISRYISSWTSIKDPFAQRTSRRFLKEKYFGIEENNEIGLLNLWLLAVCLSDIPLIIDSVTAVITHTPLLITTVQCLRVCVWDKNTHNGSPCPMCVWFYFCRLKLSFILRFLKILFVFLWNRHVQNHKFVKMQLNWHV